MSDHAAHKVRWDLILPTSKPGKKMGGSPCHRSATKNLRLSSILSSSNASKLSGDSSMSQTSTMTVRLNATLSEFLATKVHQDGAYENASEYMRDLIRPDMERKEQQVFDRLKAELTHAFSSPAITTPTPAPSMKVKLSPSTRPSRSAGPTKGCGLRHKPQASTAEAEVSVRAAIPMS